MFGVAVVLLLTLLIGPRFTVAEATEIYGMSEVSLGLYKGSELLFEWRVREARDLVDRLRRESPGDRGLSSLEARVLFFEGRYQEARTLLEKLGISDPFYDLVKITDDATREMKSRDSQNFTLSWSDPRDEILVEPALEALEAARAAAVTDLGFEPDARIRVEIYPSVSSFTSVSTLTRKEVRTSGTIGLCKFNRLMIASPRSTLHGYGWRDTLSHEYLHLSIYRLSRGRAPIWVHEGIAKYLETAWRGEYGQLNPSSEALLTRRMQEKSLISLEDMSPSVAKLESAEDTQLAFAEVGTMMSYLTEQRGRAVLPALLDAIGRGLSDRVALESVWAKPFDSFDQAWRNWVTNQPLRTGEVEVIPLTLADEGSSEEDPSVIPDREADNYVRLGDLLRERGRTLAAAAEYEKAWLQSPGLAGVVTRHLWGRMAIGRFDDAVSVSDTALRDYPELAVLWSRRGMSLLELERYGEAVDAFRSLMEINPFHIPGRRGLLSALRALDRKDDAARQEWALALLDQGEHPHGR